MSERYSKIFSLSPNLYTIGSPIVVKAGALLKDNENNLLIAQLKLQNISDKAIKLVKVEIHCHDSIGRPIDEAVAYEYLDLHIMRGNNFGTQNPIKLSNSTTRSYDVKIREVAFSDNSIWSNTDGTWKSISEQKEIRSFISNQDALVEYKSVFGAYAKYMVKRDVDLWFCTCGEINHSNEERCHKCNAAIADLESLDLNSLQREGIYSAAQALFRENTTASIKQAKEKFESIRDYKDSSDFITKCNEKLKGRQKQKSKTVKFISIISGTMVCLGLLGYFVAYPLIAKATGDYAVFINVYSIKEFKIPDGTAEVKNEEFSRCDSLTSVTIPDSVTSIGVYSFSFCTNLSSVTIPNSVTSIGWGAFRRCSSLSSITIPDSVTNIGESAFYECVGLTSITLPDSVTSIGAYAFSDCTNLSSIKFEGTVEQWYAVASQSPHWNKGSSITKVICLNGTVFPK